MSIKVLNAFAERELEEKSQEVLDLDGDISIVKKVKLMVMNIMIP